MIEEIHANLLNEKSGILVHGVNCRGKMNAGIALQIRQMYPSVYIDYTDFWGKSFKYPSSLLGQVVYTRISQKLTIASAFTQLNYSYSEQKEVSYDAVDNAFCDINKYAFKNNLIVKFPKIGCGLGGGDWKIISTIIEQNKQESVRHILFV
jgi:O-acetyl-ADP-ribose deacetylase (regulator of RNase III)